MASSPKRLKPRHTAVQGLRILLLHVVDELRRSIPAALESGKTVTNRHFFANAKCALIAR